jgi:hypothetical protein
MSPTFDVTGIRSRHNRHRRLDRETRYSGALAMEAKRHGMTG